MNKYNYFYYVVYEFEVENGGMGQGRCEYRINRNIENLNDIMEIEDNLQKNVNSKKRPIITFYSLLRKEKCV
jgi:hypothetical protein